MSEPRKLNTGEARHTSAPTPASGAPGSRSLHTGQAQHSAAAAAGGAPYAAPRPVQPAAGRVLHTAPQQAAASADAYAEARRRAQLEADQTIRMRRIQQTPRQQQGLTPAERQAIAMRRTSQLPPQSAYQAAEPYRAPAAAPQPAARPAEEQGTGASRTLHIMRSASAGPAASAAPATPAAAPQAAPAPSAAADEAPPAKPQAAAVAASDAAASASVAQAARKTRDGGKRPAKAAKPAGSAKGGGKKGGKGGKKGGGKGKWWKILLITLLVIVLIFAGAVLYILRAIRPQAGGITLSQLFNTPQEYQGKELNFLMVGIDRSTESSHGKDTDVNDGNTDMLLYVHFNNETGELKMLQIPRDYFITTDPSVSANYRINNIAKTQAAAANEMNMVALCEQVSNMFQIYIDGYVSIRLEALVELVDYFGGVELYIPQDIEFDNSFLPAGYHNLTGEQCEFFLRVRKIYEDSDITRLNMQRQFYSGLFRRLKDQENIWDVARLAPVVMNYMETNLKLSDLVSFAVSLLNVDSAKIMICQMPVYLVGKELWYNGQAVVYPARQADADLLNQYFRENTGYVDASELQLADDVVNLSGLTPTDPNIQYMRDINDEQNQARLDNLDEGEFRVDYVDPDTPAEEGADGGADAQDPAA